MFFGTFDYLILAMIFVFNFGVWKYKIIKKRNWILYLITFLFFGLIIPFFSINFEIAKATKGETNVDAFTLIYTYFRFPTWWLIGFFEVVFLRSQLHKKN